MFGEPSHTEKKLLHLIASGDENAFTHFFHQYKNKIFQVSKMYLKTDALAEEALQEIFTKIWTSRQKLTTVRDVESWLFIVSKNYLIKSLERWAKNKSVEYAWGAQQMQLSGEDETKYEQYRQVLESVIAALPAQQQAVFRLSHEEQLSYKEIAARLSLSPLTVQC